MDNVMILPVMAARSVELSLYSMANMPRFPVNVYNGSPASSYELPVQLPNCCPLCNKTFGKSIIPIISVTNLDRCHNDSSENDITSCEVISIYHCIDCGTVFAVKYEVKSKTASLFDIDDENYDAICNVLGSLPVFQQTTCFSKYIASTFSEFVNLYHQSEKAEFSGLSDICGMGYRKALEFLVHSYVRSENTKLPDNFDNLSLSQKIKQFIPDDNIKTLAERAAWLGNDNTHVVKKHVDCSVEDMKQFILAIVSYIDFKQSVKKASKIQRK